METDAERLQAILNQHREKRVVVIGTSCAGKSTLVRQIADALDMDILYRPFLSEEDAKQRIFVNAGAPVFGTVLFDCDLIVHLKIGDDLLRERHRLRGGSDETFQGVKKMQAHQECEIASSGIPVVEFDLGQEGSLMNTDFEIQIERFRATGSHCTGVVVEESLDDYQLVNNLSITKVYVTRSDEAGHRWHIYTVQVSVDAINGLCTHLRDGWYMHFWNGPWILVVFHQRWFLIDRTDVATWTDAIEYGQSIGIPKEQLDFPVPDLNEEA